MTKCHHELTVVFEIFRTEFSGNRINEVSDHSFLRRFKINIDDERIVLLLHNHPLSHRDLLYTGDVLAS